jgi:uncharacterized protein YoxC
MSKSLESFLYELRTQLSQLEGIRGEIIKNPPWGKGQIPTKAETDRKVDGLFEETARVTGTPSPTGLSAQEKIGKIKDWNAQLASIQNQAINKQLREAQAKLIKAKLLSGWAPAVAELKQAKENVANLLNQEVQVLDGRSLDDLSSELAAAEIERTEEELRSAIRIDAATYIEKYSPSVCPVCDQPLATGTIQPYSEKSGLAAQCEELRKKIAAVKQLAEDLNASRKNVTSLTEKIAGYTHNAETLLGKSSPALDDLNDYVENLNAAIQSAGNQMKDAQAEVERRDKRIRDLETEQRFHKYQEKIAAIQTVLEKDIEGPRSALRDYDNFLATAEGVAKLALEAFDTQINTSITPLAEDVTAVYERLTGHPSYDGVLIQRQLSDYDKLEPGKLELKVTSSRCPGKAFPTNVLNGQAARALQLVPYFVFSNYWRGVMELDLLLVDDPSESFDTSHLDYLMSVLSTVASHTQLIVASHETDRMPRLIDKYFSFEERCVIRVEDFDPLKGPTLEQK